jgi:uncharacterized protein (UPF0264 family)
MRLLVSVRSAAEALVAAENGADIVDAKEPAAGALGAVAAEVLAEIVDALPPEMPLGVALGDVRTADELTRVLDRIALPSRSGAVFLKLGFAGVSQAEQVVELLRQAVAEARARGASLSVVAAAYADHTRAGSPAPDAVLDAAAAAGAGGTLIDTWTKGEGGLLDYVPVAELRRWVRRARGHGLLAAVAGSVGPEAIPTLMAVEPDIVGVRGAACRGGRAGRLDPTRVRRLRAALERRPAAVP